MLSSDNNSEADGIVVVVVVVVVDVVVVVVVVVDVVVVGETDDDLEIGADVLVSVGATVVMFVKIVFTVVSTIFNNFKLLKCI
jgi:hypothetical protein